MKVHCRQLFTNKDGVKGGKKKKDGKKNILWGPLWSRGPAGFRAEGGGCF